MGIQLSDYQLEAISKMKTGCILCGGVGSGKSRTALAYYYGQQGGCATDTPMKKMVNPKDLYIITTARKRDTHEWEAEMSPFRMSKDKKCSLYKHTVVIDSWNNIGKYGDIKDAFFIFDEQRVVGYGPWATTFIKIAKNNEWILLSATPGDTWGDYMAVFIANGFYRHKTDFVNRHVVYKRYGTYQKVDKYLDTGILNYYRNSILVNMDFERKTVPHHEHIYCNYSMTDYKFILKNRWNIYEDKPIKNAGEVCYLLRKVVNSDPSRSLMVYKIFKEHPKVIIFYNFDYELYILNTMKYGEGVEVAEWNGHRHDELPTGDRWVYLVQYSAGAEGWNCITTDTIIFYSQNYSYKTLEQARGRIDRMNTPFTDLYYYHLKSRSGIDLAIYRAIKNKKQFNERSFVSSRSNRNDI